MADEWYCGSSTALISNQTVSTCFRGLLFDGPPAVISIVASFIVAHRLVKLRAPSTQVPIFWSSSEGLDRGANYVDLLRLSLLFGLALAAPFHLLELHDTSAPHVWFDAFVFRFLPFCVVTALLWTEARRAAVESWSLGLYLVLTSTASGLHLWASWEDEGDLNSEVVWWIIMCVISVCALVFALCFNRSRETLRLATLRKFQALRTMSNESSTNRMQRPLLDALNSHTNDDDDDLRAVFGEDDPFRPRSVEQDSGLLSNLLFQWFNPLVVTGYHRPLESSDFFSLRDDDNAKAITERFERAWRKITAEQRQNLQRHATVSSNDGAENDEAAEKERKKAKDRLVLRAVLTALYRSSVLRPFFEAAFFKWIYDSQMFVGPQLLKLVVGYMGEDEKEDKWYGYLLAFAMFVNAAVQTLVLQQYFHRCYRTGMRVRTALLTSIYKKSLRLTPSSRQARTVGEVVNLMSTDCQRMQDLFPYLHVIWSSPYQVTLSLYFLYAELEYAVFVALAIMILIMVPATMALARRVKNCQKDVMSAKDKRIRITSETMTSMKTLKLYGWSTSFRNMVQEARDSELVVLRKYVLLRAIARTLWTATPVIVTLGTFGSFVAFGGDLDPQTAFTALTLLNILQFPLAMLPNIFTAAIEASVSLKRVGHFFDCAELAQDTAPKVIDTIKKSSAGNFAVCCICRGEDEGFFFWDDAHSVVALRGISLTLKPGSLCAVVGKVGSGKSALLRGLIGDLPKDKTVKVNVTGKVAYAAQEPWILNCSLRENVLFGSEFDEPWYNQVIDACALRSDLDILPAGDETEIGERGINLSGGQKARVSLARAVYSKADIVYLESVFEAVDEHVGAHIWSKCIVGVLKARTVIVVTHALKHLPAADHIVVMRDGAIVEQGSYSELTATSQEGIGSEFSRLLNEVGQQRGGDEASVGDKQRALSSRVSSSEGDGFEAATSSIVVRRASSKQSSNGDKEESEVEKEKAAAAGKNLTGVEERAVGKVSNAVYAQYIRSAGGWSAALAILASLIASTALDLGRNSWLAEWSDSTSGDIQGGKSTGYYLGIYAGLSFANVGMIVGAVVIMALSALLASRRLHLSLISSVTRAPMSFFDTTPLGRLLNRFGQDMYMIDEVLPQSTYSFLSTAFKVFGTVAIIVVVTPPFAAAVPFLSLAYFFVQRYYIMSSRELKRWDSVLRSPIYSHFTETLDGVASIRAYGVQDRFIGVNQERLDLNLTAYYLSITSNRWLAIRSESIGNFLVFFASFFLVLEKGSIEASLAGLALSYALSVTQSLNWTVRMISDLETNIVSVERVNEFIATPSEAPLDPPIEALAPRKEWPVSGGLVLTDVQLRYRPDLELVLRGLSVTIKPTEKVGVVGRTGAGKSSLFLLLTRVVEPCGGKVILDGVDTQHAGLQQLRSAIAVIPQDPVLFGGSMRHNLDPFSTFSDELVWRALSITQLADTVRSLEGGLDSEVSEGGGNMSFGERQLLCIARAVLRRSPLLLMDEATSGIDLATDRLIQTTIRNEFKRCTVLTIAHRIETILDSDRVLVMDKGRCLEFDTPKRLMNTDGSAFKALADSMLAKSGNKTEDDKDQNIGVASVSGK